MIHSRTAAGYAEPRIIIWTPTSYGTGDTTPWWPRFSPPDATSPSWPKARDLRHRSSNRLAAKARRERAWPSAIATPPGPPPIALELASTEAHAPIAYMAPEHRARSRVGLRPAARQSVPPRTRRKLRTWERPS